MLSSSPKGGQKPAVGLRTVRGAPAGPKLSTGKLSAEGRTSIARQAAQARRNDVGQQGFGQIVAETVQEQLSPARVDVIVHKGTDHDGDPILHVTVVIEPDTPPLDPRKMLGLAGHIRSRLDEAHLDDFPVLSFVSKREAAKMNFDAA